MEARGGNGYIEDWVNPRLIRDAQVGLLWEGTSNINALDVIGRAVGKQRAHLALQSMLQSRLAEASALPTPFRNGLGEALDRAVALADRVATLRQEELARQAATALYDATSAILLGWEGAQPHADARRVLLARFVLTHKLLPADPLAPQHSPWERAAADALLADKPLTLPSAGQFLSS